MHRNTFCVGNIYVWFSVIGLTIVADLSMQVLITQAVVSCVQITIRSALISVLERVLISIFQSTTSPPKFYPAIECVQSRSVQKRQHYYRMITNVRGSIVNSIKHLLFSAWHKAIQIPHLGRYKYISFDLYVLNYTYFCSHFDLNIKSNKL